MIIFDVPFARSLNGTWLVNVSNDGYREFKNRQDALWFAIHRARKAQQDGAEALINVEGIDGHWRLFDHHAKGVA